jgi:probable selenium-dependent hydroxylase accessory protein YqeC
MIASEPAFENFVALSFLPGRVHTLVGAGGKSSCMSAVAGILSRKGLRVRITTTTRIGIEEFSAHPVALVRSRGDFLSSLAAEAPVQVISAGLLAADGKHRGVAADLIERVTLPPDLLLLVEGDGSRKMPMKAPRAHEPVIPGSSAVVFAFMGASAFDEKVGSENCYNPEGVLALLGSEEAIFDVPTLLLLAGHPGGCRKGVLPGMGFRLIVTMGDLADKRQTASRLLREVRRLHGIPSTLLSLREQRIYETAW